MTRMATKPTGEDQSPRMVRPGLWLIPLSLTKPLSMNDSPSVSRGARMARANQIKELRAEVKAKAKDTPIPACRKVRVTLVYEPRDNRRRDSINLVATLKPVQDGIVDAGVVPDDTPQYMESPLPLIDYKRGGGKPGRLWVAVEQVI